MPSYAGSAAVIRDGFKPLLLLYSVISDTSLYPPLFIMKYERETCNLLRRLGVNNSYVGFRYTVYGVIRAIANPELLIYISKGLYVEISAEYRTSIGCVERNIRTIISTIWLHGDRTLLNQVFGFELEQKPRNGAFIDALSHYVVEHYYD